MKINGQLSVLFILEKARPNPEGLLPIALAAGKMAIHKTFFQRLSVITAVGCLDNNMAVVVYLYCLYIVFDESMKADFKF